MRQTFKEGGGSMRITGKIAVGALGAILTLTSVAASAGTDFASGATLAVGFSLLHNNYAEYAPTGPGYFDTETGSLRGVTLAYQQMDRRRFLSENLTYVDGNTRYRGSLQYSSGKTTPYVGSSHSTIWNLDTAFGPAVAVSDAVLVAPIVGTNLYYWDRLAGGGVQGSVHEKYLHWTVAAGLAGRVTISRRVRMQLLGEATYPIYNMINTPYGAARLGRSPGYRASLSVNYRLLARLGLFARASVQWFRFGGAAIVSSGAIREPDSRTINATYTVGLSYAY